MLNLPSAFQWLADNYGSAVLTETGLVLTCGANHTKGAWQQLFAGATVAHDVWGIELYGTGLFASGVNSSSLVDIGIDPAGGASPTVMVPNIQYGGEAGIDHAGNTAFLPVFIKAGSSIHMRAQTAHSSNLTLKVPAKIIGKPSNPPGAWAGMGSETIGANTGTSAGTAITMGNATWNTTIGTSAGNWHSLGTTNRHWKYALLRFANATTAASDLATWFELGYGDGSTVVPIITKQWSYGDTAERQKRIPSAIHAYCNVPSSATLYVRGQAHTTPDSTFTASAVGVY